MRPMAYFIFNKKETLYLYGTFSRLGKTYVVIGVNGYRPARRMVRMTPMGAIIMHKRRDCLVNAFLPC